MLSTDEVIAMNMVWNRILISIELYDFVSEFVCQFIAYFKFDSQDISNTRDRFSHFQTHFQRAAFLGPLFLLVAFSTG